MGEETPNDIKEKGQTTINDNLSLLVARMGIEALFSRFASFPYISYKLIFINLLTSCNFT